MIELKCKISKTAQQLIGNTMLAVTSTTLILTVAFSKVNLHSVLTVTLN